MRELDVDMGDYSGCCAVVILNWFPNHEDYTDEGTKIPCKIELTDAEWFYILRGIPYPLVTFAHSSGGNTGACTPAKLAKWLRRKGEKVHTGARAVNPSTKNTVTIYTWAPSKAFNKKSINYSKKKNKQDADNRGARAD